MKNIFNVAQFAGVSAIAIGVALHQYKTSYEEVCDSAVGSNVFSKFAEAVTGQNVSSAGQWHSVTGSAVCDAVGTVEGAIVKMANSVPKLMGG